MIGNQTQWGIEGEMRWTGCGWTLVANHAYTKLLNFSLDNPDTLEVITASPYGYGNNLANWSPNITKLVAHRKLTPCLAFDGSLRWYWGYPGLKDMADYFRDLDQAWVTKAQPSWQRTWRGSMFLDLALTYQYSEHTRFRVDGYNLLGGFDHDLNKRIYYSDIGFISEAPALGLSCEMTF